MTGGDVPVLVVVLKSEILLASPITIRRQWTTVDTLPFRSRDRFFEACAMADRLTGKAQQFSRVVEFSECTKLFVGARAQA